MLLYRSGVLTGSDAFGTFYPNNNISRAEAAAILARIAIPAERKVGHQLLEYWYLGETLEFVMPQGSVLTEEAEGGAAVESMDGNHSIMLSWAADPAYETLTIEVFTPDEWHDLLLTSYEGDGMLLTDAKTDAVRFGSIPAYRFTAAAGDSQVVVIGYIADSELMLIQYLALDGNVDGLSAMANLLLVHNTLVNKPL